MRQAAKISASILVVLFVLPPIFSPILADSQAQACDASIQSVDGSLGYGRREGDVRCEGLYRSPVGAPSIEVVSFYQGVLAYSLSDSVVLQVSVSRDNRDLPDSIHIRAQALPLNTFYRMDASLAVGDALHWPVNDVLLPAGINSQRIGLYAWTGTEQEKTLIPVVVHEDRGLAQPDSDNTTASLKVRCAVATESVWWRSYESDTKPSQWVCIDEPYLSPGSIVTIELTKSLNSISAIEVAAELPDRDEWQTLLVKLLLPRLEDAESRED